MGTQRAILKLLSFGILLIIGTAIAVHPLSNLQPLFKKLGTLYTEGRTSEAFSLAMQLHLQVKSVEKELQIGHPTEFEIKMTENTCQHAIKEISDIVSNEDWVQKYQEINGRFQFLQNYCTNRDFQYGIINSDNLKGSQIKCAGCVVVFQVIRNYILYHKKDVTNFIQRELCTLFYGAVKPTCQAFVHFAGPQIIKAMIQKQGADALCLKIGFCNNPNCRFQQKLEKELDLPTFTDGKPAPWDWIVDLFVNKFGDSHRSPFDLDWDGFSDVSTFRGYDWRGVDCNEFSNKVYPGRKTRSNDLLDHDCNGIYGYSGFKKSYEEVYCSEQKTGSKRLGVIVVGDSAGAHFSIPEKFMNASMIGKGTFNDLLTRAANQLDRPQFSGYTGHVDTALTEKRHSVYKYLRNWNLCNNNDYQNIAVNGGDSSNTQPNIKALKRDPQNDHPALIFLQLVGNDVCVDSFQQMTTTTKFKENILKILNWLDKNVPKGSHLFMFGFADGQLLFKYLSEINHPLNVTYATVYDFLNCLQISPCWSWLNTNATVRQFATERAQNLSKVYQQIIDDSTTFENFDMVYYDFPSLEILNQKLQEGGDPKELIEKCDGFHPNGQFHSRLADWIWFKIRQNHPQWIGQQNPHNAEIKKVFGLKDIQ